MLSRLDGRLLKSLHTALLGAFDHAELELLLRTELNARLADISLNAQGLSDVVTALIAWAERRGHIPQLLDALIAARPGRPEFSMLRDELSARFKGGGGDGPERADPEPPPTVSGDGARTADPAAVLAWAERMMSTARSVALLEVGDRASTAIALSRRLVLCPSFPVRGIVDGTEDPGAVRVTFGYLTGADGDAERSTWELDRDLPIVDHDNDLDFALLLLGAPLPPEAFGGAFAEQVAAMRGTAAPVVAASIRHGVPKPGSPLFILGHVLGAPVAIESTFAREHTATRLHYARDGQMRPGIAGAPVVDADGRVVAMHQGLDPNGSAEPLGFGVPVAAVLERPTVKLALAVSKPAPEPRGMEIAEMAI